MKTYKLLIYFLLLATSCKDKKKEASTFIEESKAENKASLDSMQRVINNFNKLRYKIEYYIDNNQLTSAELLIETLKRNGNIHLYHIYKGMILEKKLKFSSALGEYNTAIQYERYSIGLSKRASLFKRMNRLDESLNDYRLLLNTNYDYNLPIAEIFEIKNLKDSSLKYYKIYLKHYPSDQLVLKKIEYLKSKIEQ